MFKPKWWIKSYLKQPIATPGNLFSLADHNYSESLGYMQIVVDIKDSAAGLSHLFKHP